ncbi:MAG: bifunctional oligoribonuclease/PAP phosphatase NrnA [FCB group bacterium]|nr:bifunctional oligoribonuclease/PAP phosphatase NrnA [FCB group bacterium]
MVDWKNVNKLINEAQQILLTTHEKPDGDGLGCAAAMYHYLIGQGKDCRVINHSSLPAEYRFLDPDGVFETYRSDTHDTWLEKADLVIIFDVGDYKRLQSIGIAIQRFALKTLNIDHHPYPGEPPFSMNVVDEQAAATGELIYNYLKTVIKGPLSKEICVGLYTAIMTDTGSFRYNNTNIRSHEIAIECIRSGIDQTYIYQQVYESHSPARMKLLGKILNSLQFELEGELAWFSINATMLKEVGATKEDVDGFTDFIRTIRGVEVALMVFQSNHRTCRVNFRSKGKYAVNEIAKSLGGGGHRFAAGAVVEGLLDAVVPRVLSATKQSLISQNGHGR